MSKLYSITASVVIDEKAKSAAVSVDFPDDMKGELMLQARLSIISNFLGNILQGVDPEEFDEALKPLMKYVKKGAVTAYKQMIDSKESPDGV